MKKILATISGFFLCATIAHAGEWIEDLTAGCKVWEAYPRDKETITWSGSCSSDNKATGNGILKRYFSKNGILLDQFEGEIQNGRLIRGKRTKPNGSVMEIEVKNGKEYGKGVDIWVNARFEGDLIDGKWQKGVLVVWEVDDKTRAEGLKAGGSVLFTGMHEVGRYEGEFDGVFKQGKGVFVWPDGRRYEGVWFKSLHIGKNPVFFDSARCEVDYPDAKWRGTGVCTWEQGDRYEGDFVERKRTGKGIYTWANGGRYEGDFVDGKLTGKGSFTWPESNRNCGTAFCNKKFVGEFSNNNHTCGSLEFWNGDSYEGCFDPDGKMKGQTKNQLANSAKTTAVSKCVYNKQVLLSTRAVTVSRQDLPSTYLVYADGCSVRFPIEAISKGLFETTYKTQALLAKREVIEAKWNGKCNNGLGTGPGTLTFALSDNGSCSPDYWFSFTGNTTDGIFAGKVSVSHNMEQAMTTRTNVFYVHLNDSFSTEREYVEAVNPQRRIAREDAERKEREQYERERKREEDTFSALLRSQNPRNMFLAAVAYEDKGDLGRAKTVYRAIMNRHGHSQEALQAASRLTRLSDVEAIESSGSRAANASYDAAESIKKQNYDQCMNDRNSCYGRCMGIKNYSARDNCERGCPLCVQ